MQYLYCGRLLVLLLTSFYKAAPVWGEVFLDEHGFMLAVIARAALNALVYARGAVGCALRVFSMLGFVFNFFHDLWIILTYFGSML